MLARRVRQHNTAAWFGVNGGRIVEIASGQAFSFVLQEDGTPLPPRGPYASGQEAERHAWRRPPYLPQAAKLLRRFGLHATSARPRF